jgi:hypothetical protein
MNPSRLVDDILDALKLKTHFRIIEDVDDLRVGATP